MIRCLSFCLLFSTVTCGQVLAGFTVLRDSIFSPDPNDGLTTWTDGLGGASALDLDLLTWNVPGFVLEVPENGILTELQMVIFAGSNENHVTVPENDLENILGYSMQFHLWSDGAEGGPDSFSENARPVFASLVPGHVAVDVNTLSESFITAEEFGQTGPGGTEFTTFLITVDLSSFGIQVQADQQYVVAIVNRGNFSLGGRGTFRVSHSRATGFEDVFQVCGEIGDSFCPNALPPDNERPGYLKSQLFLPVEQLSGRVSIGNGNYDGDLDVDGADFLKWQRDLGTTVVPSGDGADGNGNGTIDTADLNVWEATYGQTFAPSSTAATVPEPDAFALALLAIISVMFRDAGAFVSRRIAGMQLTYSQGG